MKKYLQGRVSADDHSVEADEVIPDPISPSNGSVDKDLDEFESASCSYDSDLYSDEARIGATLPKHVKYELVDEEPPKSRDLKYVGTCQICTALATGLHYGVTSCEACKAFFKRTIQGNAEYRCQSGSNCDVTKKQRKQCPHCRFQKCLNIGMLVEGVRLDRMRGGRQKYWLNPETNKPEIIKSKKKDEFKILTKLLEIEVDFRLPSSNISLTEEEYINISPENMLSVVTGHLHSQIIDYINWFKRTPVFFELDIDLKVALFQSAWGELIVSWIAFRSCPFTEDGPIVEGENFSCRRDIFARCGAASIYDSFSTVALAMTRLHLSTEEFTLLKMLILLSDLFLNTQADQRTQVAAARKSAMEDLCRYSQLHHRDNNTRICEVLLLLPIIKQSFVLSLKFWSGAIDNDKINFPELFGSMLSSSDIYPVTKK